MLHAYCNNHYGNDVINQKRSHNLQRVPQNFMKVFNVDDIILTS